MPPELISRCKSFWNRTSVATPLCGVLVNRMAPLKHAPFKPGLLTAADITVEAFLAECERRHHAAMDAGGDTPYVAYPWAGLPWLDAMLGMPAQYEGGYAWSERLPTDWQELTDESIPWDNGWFNKLTELTQAAITTANGRYPVGPTHLHGPVDLAAAMMGAEQLALAVYDAPEALHKLLTVITTAWLKVVDAQYAVLPQDNLGYWNGNQPLWIPGRNMMVPADAVSMLAPDTVEEFVAPCLRRITEHLDYCIAHTHSTYLHAIDPVLEIPGFQCIQVGLDVNGPVLEEVLPVMRKIQETQSMIVAVCQTEVGAAVEQARTVLRELEPTGLCILVYLETAEKGQQFFAQLESR